MSNEEISVVLGIKKYLVDNNRELLEENYDEEGNILYCLESFENDFYVNTSTENFFGWVSEWIDEQNEHDNNELNITAKDFYNAFTNDEQYSFIVNDVVYAPFCIDIDGVFNEFYESVLS